MSLPTRSLPRFGGGCGRIEWLGRGTDNGFVNRLLQRTNPSPTICLLRSSISSRVIGNNRTCFSIRAKTSSRNIPGVNGCLAIDSVSSGERGLWLMFSQRLLMALLLRRGDEAFEQRMRLVRFGSAPQNPAVGWFTVRTVPDT